MFTLLTLIAALLMLFAGYPILHELYRPVSDTRGAFNIGGTNGSGQVPLLSALRPLRDPDSPPSAYTWRSAIHGTTLELQFSDEFNTPGRTFWPGDDQFVSGACVGEPEVACSSSHPPTSGPHRTSGTVAHLTSNGTPPRASTRPTARSSSP